MVLIIIAVLLIFICGQIYLKKLRKETEKNASEISTAENENFEVEQIVKTYRNEEQYQKKRSRLYLQMIFFAGVLMILGFGWYLYQEYKEALSLEKMRSAVPEWQSVKDDFPNLFVPSAEVQERLFAEYQAEQIAKLQGDMKDYCKEAYGQISEDDLASKIAACDMNINNLKEELKNCRSEYYRQQKVFAEGRNSLIEKYRTEENDLKQEIRDFRDEYYRHQYVSEETEEQFWAKYQENMDELQKLVKDYQTEADLQRHVFTKILDDLAAKHRAKVTRLQELSEDYKEMSYLHEKLSELNKWQKMTAAEYWNSNTNGFCHFCCWFCLILFLGFVFVYSRLKFIGFKVFFGVFSLILFCLLLIIPDFYTPSELLLWECLGCVWLFCIIYFGRKKYCTDC